jgi:hypothetical protein
MINPWVCMLPTSFCPRSVEVLVGRCASGWFAPNTRLDNFKCGPVRAVPSCYTTRQYIRWTRVLTSTTSSDRAYTSRWRWLSIASEMESVQNTRMLPISQAMARIIHCTCVHYSLQLTWPAACIVSKFYLHRSIYILGPKSIVSRLSDEALRTPFFKSGWTKMVKSCPWLLDFGLGLSSIRRA